MEKVVNSQSFLDQIATMLEPDKKLIMQTMPTTKIATMLTPEKMLMRETLPTTKIATMLAPDKKLIRETLPTTKIATMLEPDKKLIMQTMPSIRQKSREHHPKFANFGEYLFWAYANLQMLHAAVVLGKRKYDRTCYMIRSKAFKAYKEGRWNIHNLLEFNIAKIKENNYCWYCGKEMASSKLTKDHVFPKSKGGANEMDNIIMVCKTCNSSKGKMDLFEWYFAVRKEWPPVNILIHYLKNIYLYSIDNGLMTKHADEMNAMELPFKWQYIPLDYPQPEHFIQFITHTLRVGKTIKQKYTQAQDR